MGLDCGLVEVMGLGLITCGEGVDVDGVHTLLSGVVPVCHELIVCEEEEKEEEQGPHARGTPCGWYERRDSNLEPWCMCLDEIKMTI